MLISFVSKTLHFLEDDLSLSSKYFLAMYHLLSINLKQLLFLK